MLNPGPIAVTVKVRNCEIRVIINMYFQNSINAVAPLKGKTYTLPGICPMFGDISMAQ